MNIPEENNNIEDDDCPQEDNQLKMLQNKIRSQAKRLCSLQEYISLCEKRLIQYNPNEIFPLTENTSFQYKNNNAQFNTSTAISSINYENLYNDLKQKYNNLYESLSQSKQIPNRQSMALRYDNKREIPPEEIFNEYERLCDDMKKIQIEKKKMVQSLKNEIVINDEQRNQIEILKQTIETSLIKSGLKTTIDLLNNKYYPGNGEGNYAQIILDVSQLKDRNEEMTRQNATLNQLLEEAEKFKEKILIAVNNSIKELESAHQKIDSLESDKAIIEELLKNQSEMNNQLNEKIVALRTDLQQSKVNNKELEDKISEFKVKYEAICYEFNSLKECNQNNEMQIQSLSSTLNEVKANKDSLDEQVISLQDFEVKYNELLKQHFDIKKMNQSLSNDNHILIEDNEHMKSQLTKLNLVNQIEEESKKMYNEICNLKEQIEILQVEKNKNENYFLSQIEAITQERNSLENILIKQEKDNKFYEDSRKDLASYKGDNKKLYDKNRKLYDENIKYSSENQFYSKLIIRITKHHINNMNVKNILFELLSLNEKMLILSIEKAKMDKKIGNEQLYNQIKCSQEKEINDLYSRILLLDKELKNYE